MEKKACGCWLRSKSKEDLNAELRQDAARIVADVENYSSADKTKRVSDLKAAFPPVKAVTKSAGAAKVAVRAAAKPTAKAKAKPAAKSSKGPAPAGMSVGRHDGDTC